METENKPKIASNYSSDNILRIIPNFETSELGSLDIPRLQIILCLDQDIFGGHIS